MKTHSVSTHTVSNYALPRQLKRPYFAFFRVFTIVYVLAVIVAAIVWLVSHSPDALALTAMIGGSLWVGFFMGVLFNWQSLTVFDDHLLFNSFGKKNTVLYKDIGEVKVEEPRNGEVPMLTLFLHHQGQAKSPLKINLKLFSTSDRVLLLQLIKENGPHAHLNSLAEKIRQSK